MVYSLSATGSAWLCQTSFEERVSKQWFFDCFYAMFSIISKRCYGKIMKEPLSSGFTAYWPFAWPNFVRRRGRLSAKLPGAVIFT